jgi:hypothetical protein
MASFIQNVIADLQKKDVDISQLTFVLPSKRAGVFLTNCLSQSSTHSQFAPEIYAIEEFVETLSELSYSSNTELLFQFYEVYLKSTPEDQIESFDKFSKWAQLLLQDFNEIDRYLVPADRIFDYLKAIKELNHWSLAEDQTDYIINYLSFWKRIKLYYHQLREELIQKKKGYQGLVYREAVEGLEQYIVSNSSKKHVFVGFNALNKAEETIIQELLQQELATIYWDIDATFIENPIHDAGLFIRSHKSEWPYFQRQPMQWIDNVYKTKKHIEVIGTPKNIGQVKYIGELLEKIREKQPSMLNTAIVLGDETLLMPLLNSIPKSIDTINITMGLPLDSIPLASLFEALFKIHKVDSKQLYYKDVIAILSHQFIIPLIEANSIIDYLQKNNVVYISYDNLKALIPNGKVIIKQLFQSWDNNPDKAIKSCSGLILSLKEVLSVDKSKNLIALEYLYRFNEIFNELQKLNSSYKHLYNINTLFGLYKELLKSETLDFKGEPLRGLQIMGMLESRVLDFDTVIISSVNEGILPAGKSNNSFIPFDVKLENGLPTYKEKDAVYTYHFYRLLQRAKNIYIIYNTEPDVLNGGEKSRFITQLEIEKIHSIQKYIVSPYVPSIESKLKSIKKTPAVIEKLKDLAQEGFSPSSLTNYIRNPMDFYYDKILGIKRYEEVEEIVANNTLGNVIHQTLEDFYKPLKNQFLTENHIIKMKTLIEKTVEKHFKSHYKEGDITKGKNLIVFEIAKRYIYNFLTKEQEALKAGNQIKIIDVEKKTKIQLQMPELGFPVFLKGTVDRIDEYNGITRIIDYKTGRVEQKHVEIVDWKNLVTDYEKYSKSFQVLAYAYMLTEELQVTGPIEGGIVSFKNLQGDYFLKFTKKDKLGKGATKDNYIAQKTINEFSVQLKNLIAEICDTNIDFVEKLIK